MRCRVPRVSAAVAYSDHDPSIHPSVSFLTLCSTTTILLVYHPRYRCNVITFLEEVLPDDFH